MGVAHGSLSRLQCTTIHLGTLYMYIVLIDIMGHRRRRKQNKREGRERGKGCGGVGIWEELEGVDII